mgnify:CR=1 FL=1
MRKRGIVTSEEHKDELSPFNEGKLFSALKMLRP